MFDAILRINAFMDSSLWFRNSGDAIAVSLSSQLMSRLLLPYDELVYIQGVDIALAECI